MRRLCVLLLGIALVAVVALALWERRGAGTPPAATPAPRGAGTATPDAGAAGAVPAVAATDAATAATAAAADRLAAAPAVEFAAERTGYRGRVVSRAGAPVPGMEVALFRGAPDLLLWPGVDAFARDAVAPQFLAGRTRSGDDGRFVLDGVLPRGLCFLRLCFPDVARAPLPLRPGHGTVRPVQRTPAPGEIVDLGDVMLKAGATLTGRVVDDAEHPVGGALVRAARLPPIPFGAVPVERLRPDGVLITTIGGQASVLEIPHWLGDALALLPIPTTTSAPDGAFVLYGVDAGDNVVAATTPGRGSLLRQGVAVAAETTVSLGDLMLPAGEEVDVAVTDAAGTPVAGAEVVVAPQSVGVPVHIGERIGSTGSDGRAHATGLPRSRALAAARRTRQESWVVGEAAPPGAALRVVLPALFALTLSVLGADNQPARDVQLKLVDASPNVGAIELSLFGMLRGIDLGDRLRRLDDGRLRIERLRPGAWCALIGARDCASTSLDVDLRADVERTVVLRPARALRVRAIDFAAAPVAEATIYVQARGGGRAQRIVDIPLAAGRTDRDGWCTVRDLPTDETALTASHPLHGQVHAMVSGAPPEVVLQFAPSGEIAGRLTDGGRAPAPGRWVVVLERNQDKAPRPAVPDLPQLALPDLDGEFAFAALQPGKYRLTAQDSAADVGTVGGLWQYMARRKQIFPWNKAEVELHGGERKEVRLDAMIDPPAYAGPGAIVRGTVTIDGAPGEGALVVGHSTAPDRTVTNRVDRGGTFDLGLVPAGKLRVTVVPREVAESRLLEHLFSHHFARDLVVVDGVGQDLAIDIATGAVTGFVRDWNGAPVDGCRVVLFDRGGDGRSSALRVERSDDRGAFRFPQLPAGTFEVRAHKEGFGTATSKGVAVVAGGETGPVLIELRAVARVEGRVDVAALPKRAPIGLTLLPMGGGEPVRGGAKADGPFELKDVPEGRYRVELQLWADPVVYAAGELDVRAPATTGVVLLPRPR